MPKKVKGYRLLDACANCKLAYRRRFFERADELYCTNDAPPRPTSGAELPDTESFYQASDGDDTAKCMARAAAWMAWSKGREVAPNGYCECHEKEKP